MPEWLKGTDCKSVAVGYDGSNPSLPTIFSAWKCWKENWKYLKKTLDKWLKKRYYKQADLRKHTDESPKLWGGSVPWKLNNAIRNHAHMISSQMLDSVSAMRMQNINKTRFVRNTIWNSITWIILRANQGLLHFTREAIAERLWNECQDIQETSPQGEVDWLMSRPI